MIRLWLGDSVERLGELSEVRAIVTDPPYGLEFMGKDWDAPWKTGAGMSKPGIGDRPIEWPSFGGSVAYGGANPTCETCGGRARGAKKCECEEPDWRVDGEPLEDVQGMSMSLKQRHDFQAWCVSWLVKCHEALVPGGIIKVFGGTRMFHRMAAAMEQAGFEMVPGESLEAWVYGSGFPKSLNVAKALDKHLLGEADGTPKSDEAKKFDGYGTALKPAWEPFLVGRKAG